MGIGDFGRRNHLFFRGTFHAEGNVVVNGVVKEDGLLVHITHEGTEVLYGQVPDVFSVKGDAAAGNVPETGNEVHQGRFSGTGFAHDGNHFPAWNLQAHMVQDLARAVIAEGYVLQADALPEILHFQRLGGILDGVLRLQDFVDALHGSQALAHAVGGAGEFLDGLYHRVQDNEEINEGGGVDEFAAPDEAFSADNHDAAHAEHNHDHDGAQEFAHGVGRGLADAHAGYLPAHTVRDVLEAAAHGAFCIERLDDPEAAQGFIHLAHGVAPQGLCLQRGALKLLADHAHNPHEGRCKNDGENHHFRAEPGKEAKIDEDENGVLDEHGQGGHNGVFHFRHIPGNAGNDVPFALLRKKADGKAQDLVVNAAADFLDDPRRDGNHDGVGTKIAAGFEGREKNHDARQQEQGVGRAMGGGEGRHIIIQVVHRLFLEVHLGVPRNKLIHRLVYLEQDIQQRNYNREGEDIEDGAEHVQHH